MNITEPQARDGPVYVVTAAASATGSGREAGATDERAGCLAGFASECSIRPPRFLVWLSTLNHTYRVVCGASHLAVHVLGRDQRELAELFGSETGDRTDKFARAEWVPSADGSPLLTGAPAWFVGRIEARVDGGDHTGFLLAPTEASPALRDVPELLRYGDVREIAPGHPA
ncbi:flavin reductase family protein [Streptomyces sp. NBC_01264]|uniref:flavin reductase family protein n=1 Tax=Streptomyces sp. NBC_01264 TaxID=2903804 RepID=UPI002258E990|nr:flavin reductase family protein [Streptomyces sp. NBC_01264]MCX4775936.1 flavin reductase family protein [Streptomyces sp. NBC_01264]